jgi:TonB family protein
MRRVAAFALGLLPLLAPPARAQQLSFTTHVEMRKVETPAPDSPAVSALYAILASGLSGNAARDVLGGSADFTIALNPKEFRLQASKPTGWLSEGTTQVVYANNSALFVNSASKTFWRFPEPPAAVLAAREDRSANLNASMSIKRTGEFAEIAGVRAEHVTFDVTFNPIGLPPALIAQGLPLKLTGEAWLASQYKSYAALQTRVYPTLPTGVPLLGQLDDGGFALRLIIRGDVLGGYEIEHSVTRIAEGPASTFEVPEDYTEVYRVRPDITAPRKIRDAAPVYTAQAMRARIEGQVTLEGVVATDGILRDIRVLKSLDPQYGLDQAAINAVRQWQFEPALRGGTPINVIVTVQIAFHLRRPTLAPSPPAAP